MTSLGLVNDNDDQPVSPHFPLSASALPNLRAVRSIHGGPSVVAAVMKGRAVTEVSVPIYSGSALQTLDALELGAATIRRLNIISFDSQAPEYILPEVARRFKDMEALHLVLLLTQCTEQMLEDVAPMLGSFTRLKVTS
jgi:hypothetical protein